MNNYKKTSDGRYIGYLCWEITSFPDAEYLNEDENNLIKDNADEFERLVKEFYKICQDNSASLEILWVTEPVSGQTYKCDIRVFIIMRKMSSLLEVTQHQLDKMSCDVSATLKLLKYKVKKVANIEELKRTFISVECESAYLMLKKERYVNSSIARGQLFYCDVLANDNRDNFESIISLLSEMRDCAVSFQLFPTLLSQEDKFLLGDVANYYNGLSNGAMQGNVCGKDIAAEPANVINYYYGNANNSLFYYNILIWGEKRNCEVLSGKLSTVLNSGNEKVMESEFTILDASGLKTRLYQDFYTYPWNLNMFAQSSCLYGEYYGNLHLLAKRLSIVMTSEEVRSFFRLPIHNKKTMALKSKTSIEATEQLSSRVVDKDNIQFGYLQTETDMPLTIGCSDRTFSRHTLIVGMPGTGKTTFSLGLLLQFYKKGIPFLAVEPTKTEYRALIDAIPDIQIFTPGNNEVSPFIINPFVPPRGIKVEQYIPALVSAFNAAFSMPSPLDVLFLSAIRKTYTKYGWKDYSKYGDEDVTEFGLYEFILVFKQLIKESAYSKEVKGNLESGGTFRLLNLIEQNGNIYDTVNTISIEDLLRNSTVIELNAIQDGEQKALIMALLLSSICLYTKVIQKGDGKTKNIILIDEAHVLLDDSRNEHSYGKSDAQGATIKSLQAMIAEIRSYGTGIIIADQSPRRISREIVANTDVKVAFRLVEQTERDMIANSTNMNKNMSEQLSRLHTGEAFVYWSDFEMPQLIMTPDVRDEMKISLTVSNEEIATRATYWKTRRKQLRPYLECKYCKACKEDCDYYIRSDASHYADIIFYECKKYICDQKIFESYLANVDKLLQGKVPDMSQERFERLVECCMIKLRRKVQLETELRSSKERLCALLRKREGR